MSSRNPQPLSMQWNNRRPPARPPNAPVLRVAVQGSEIVVSASGTDDYVVKYHKLANSPQLLARSFPRKEDRRVSMTLADFLTAAWKLANDKARELGWIA
jgi:hypothetical protein